MKKIVFLLILVPLFLVAQTKSKPKTSPKTPVKSTVSAKPNPLVNKLVDSAYVLYKSTKDKECEAIIKKILVLSPKNKDAFLLRANLAMFAEKNDEVWKNLDIAYKYYPKEPEIYSQFAMAHINYTFLSDSMKRVLCRRTIKLAPKNAEGFVSLGMVALIGGNFNEALRYFNVGNFKEWKEESSKIIVKLPYARCQYETGNTEGAIETLNDLIPQISGTDKFTAMYMRAFYKMEIGNTDIKNDLDSLNSNAGEQLGIMKLNATYFKKINKQDTACAIARKIRLSEGGESLDLSEYCNDLTTSINIKEGNELVYETENEFFKAKLVKFNINNEIKFNWIRTETERSDSGEITISKAALDSATNYQINFENGIKETLNERITLWLSNKQLNELRKDSITAIYTNSNIEYGKFAIEGHEQLEILNKKNKPELIDCIKITNGYERIWYLNDPSNPLIVKIQLNKYKLTLFKVE